jgi:hypothetical protein
MVSEIFLFFFSHLKNFPANKEKLLASSQKIIEEESPSDDRGSSSDGAMCSRSQKGTIYIYCILLFLYR